MLVGNVVVGLAAVAAAAAVVEDVNSPPAGIMIIRIKEGRGHCRVDACYRCVCCHWAFYWHIIIPVGVSWCLIG